MSHRNSSYSYIFVTLVLLILGTNSPCIAQHTKNASKIKQKPSATPSASISWPTVNLVSEKYEGEVSDATDEWVTGEYARTPHDFGFIVKAETKPDAINAIAPILAERLKVVGLVERTQLAHFDWSVEANIKEIIEHSGEYSLLYRPIDQGSFVKITNLITPIGSRDIGKRYLVIRANIIEFKIDKFEFKSGGRCAVSGAFYTHFFGQSWWGKEQVVSAKSFMIAARIENKAYDSTLLIQAIFSALKENSNSSTDLTSAGSLREDQSKSFDPYADPAKRSSYADELRELANYLGNVVSKNLRAWELEAQSKWIGLDARTSGNLSITGDRADEEARAYSDCAKEALAEAERASDPKGKVMSSVMEFKIGLILGKIESEVESTDKYAIGIFTTKEGKAAWQFRRARLLARKDKIAEAKNRLSQIF